MFARPWLTRLAVVVLVAMLASLSPVAPASAATILRQGSRGTEVVQLQSRLDRLGYEVGAADGIFGPRTRAAVLAFQRDRSLTRDGIVGPRTRAALALRTAPPASRTPSSPDTTTTLRQGARGAAVTRLQTRLAQLHYDVGTVDGVFGPATRHAVVAFQKVNGLARDGIVGPRTHSAMRRPVVPTVRRVHTGTSVEIDVTRQVLFVAEDGHITRIVNTSTGRPGLATPIGEFRIERRIDGWRHAPLGTLWRPVYFHGGHAIHGYPSIPSTAASSGCARVPNASMNRMWPALQVGTPVHVHR